ncbi:hypothetical protein CYMTET_22461 [Cymbomonas tetramitiformis]|uniref:Uncharacterized protein n=1 Tax=Cymbomonas tetramitiformis TaxID=36881 RepID=A0AAE0G0Q6_9CHLO|nr:hypothetical protein CYMTET_22461 [Cymbomonas tetramitiformis]
MFCSSCSEGESELSASSNSSGSEDYYYETVEDFLGKTKTIKPRKAKSSEPEAEPKTSGYGPNNTAENLTKIGDLMDPANECKCGRRCLSQFEYRPVQTYLREKFTLNGRQFKENIIAELTRAHRFKPGSQKLEIEMSDSLTFLGKKVCKDAFRRLHFIPESTWFKWHAHVCGGGMLESTSRRNATLYNDPTNLNWTYFLEYAAHEILPLAEPQPQNGKLQMSPIRPADCYAAYKLMRRGVYQVQVTQFRKYLREYLRAKHITMRKRKDCAGHSHNDVDGFFGLLKMLLWGKAADKLGHWFISLQQWIAFLFAWTITTINKYTYVIGCNLDFKSWIDPHLNEEFGGHAGRDRKVHTWCMYVAPDEHVRAKYKFGDRFKEWLPSGVDEDPNLGLISCTSYPDVDSAPGYMDNPEWKRKGKGNKVLDMEQTTRSCLLGLRAATPDLVSQQRHEELKATFPLPLKVEAVRERLHPEQLPPKWDLSLLLTRAHTRASTVKSDGLLKTRYAKAEQFNVCFDGVTHKKQAVEKEVLKNIDINEVVAFMREAKYCTELISRR